MTSYMTSQSFGFQLSSFQLSAFGSRPSTAATGFSCRGYELPHFCQNRAEMGHPSLASIAVTSYKIP